MVNLLLKCGDLRSFALFASAMLMLIVGGCKTASKFIPSSQASPSIRQFDIALMEKIGRTIFQKDGYASEATDILFEKVGGPHQLDQQNVRGWITREVKGSMMVSFMRMKGGAYLPAYDIVFTPQRGHFVNAEGREASSEEMAMFKARQLALQNIPRRCSRRYNAVVVSDVDGDGYLVYTLAATTDPNLILLGGHYRFTISQDASTIEKIDALFKSCMAMDKRKIPNDAKSAGMYITHLVSDTPVETHVFLSLLHKLPIYVGTPGDRLWKVNAGRISIVK